MAHSCVRKPSRAPHREREERGWVVLECARCLDRTPHRRLVFQVPVGGMPGMALSVPGHRCLECGREERAGGGSRTPRTIAWESRIGAGT